MSGVSNASFFTHGVSHVLTGWDHLLFAAALVLALRSFWEVFKVIGVFTVAHSLTVALTVWKGAPLLSPAVVEPCIAASIVIVAVENIFFPQSAVSRRRLVVAFLFGLVHGLGLAGALLEDMTGVTASGKVLAVVAFCVGVEAGHLCFVAPFSGLLKIGYDLWLERFRHYSMRYGSAVVGCAGLYYFVVYMRTALGYDG